MEPVRVCGWATILWAAIEIQYPPEPATSDIETTNGFSFLARKTSRQMTSEATAEPPGLSTLSTMASTVRSSRACRIQRARVAPPIVSGVLSPLRMGPTA